MSRRPRLTGAARVAERRRENFDMFLGLLGFFAVLIFISTVAGELRGEPSLAHAVSLAVFVVLILLTLRIRRGLQDKVARAVEEQKAESG